MKGKQSEILGRKIELAEAATSELQSLAIAYAKGKTTTEALLAAAKKATNAWHAVGRVQKGKK